MRVGLIAEKIGMTQFFDDNGVLVPITVLKVEPCTVIALRTKEKDGYVALQLGAGAVKEKKVAKPQRVQFAKANVALKKDIVEFRVSDDCVVPVGSELSVNHFVKGQYVDVIGTSIGKGYAGVMKRWNFHGDNATHGVSLTHRSAGSTGQRQDPGKVFKGHKMPGHLGAVRVTVQNLQVVDLDEDKGLIMVKGAVPGFDGNMVIIKDAVKRAVPKDAPIPAGLKTQAVEKETQPTAEAAVEEVKQEVEAPVEAATTEEVKE